MLTKEQLNYVKNLDEGLRLALVNIAREKTKLDKQSKMLSAQRDITQDILKLGKGWERLFPNEKEVEDGLS